MESWLAFHVFTLPRWKVTLALDMDSSGCWCQRRRGRHSGCWGRSGRRRQNGRPCPGTPRRSVWSDCSYTWVRTSLRLMRKNMVVNSVTSSELQITRTHSDRGTPTHPRFLQCLPRSQRSQSSLWLPLQTLKSLRYTSHTLRCRTIAPGLENKEFTL